MHRQVETLESDKAKLTDEVAKLTESKEHAMKNWKKWSDKSTARKAEISALIEERDSLKKVSDAIGASQSRVSMPAPQAPSGPGM